MKVVVTGAAGMIGANLVHGLNAIGIDDVIAVDDLSDGTKYKNLLGASISDYFDRRDFYARFERGEFGRVDCVFHEGACSDTMEHDGRLMLDLNYRASKTLLDACLAQKVRLLYASSAATYGGSASFREEPEFERPLNVYGWSKLLFDNVVRRALPAARTQLAGFRYFNVYGPREQHKGRMASVAFHHFEQWQAAGRVKLFGEYGGYAAGEQRRDAGRRLDVDGPGRDRIERTAQAAGVPRLVLWEQPAQHLAQTFVDQMDLCQVPGRIADIEASEMAILVRHLEAAAVDGDGAVALALGALLGPGEGDPECCAVGTEGVRKNV